MSESINNTDSTSLPSTIISELEEAISNMDKSSVEPILSFVYFQKHPIYSEKYSVQINDRIKTVGISIDYANKIERGTTSMLEHIVGISELVTDSPWQLTMVNNPIVNRYYFIEVDINPELLNRTWSLNGSTTEVVHSGNLVTILGLWSQGSGTIFINSDISSISLEIVEDYRIYDLEEIVI